MEVRREPPINYVWIGPPAKAKGQDIDGPIQLAELKKEVKFWCLREHLSAYESTLKPKGITVYAIEELFEQKHPDPQIQKMIDQYHIMVQVLLQKKRNTIRDRVTLNNATSLLILLLQGGYFFDTNVGLADPTKPCSLPNYDTFKYPFLINNPRRSGIYSGTYYDVAEVWALYAPEPSLKMTENLRLMFDSFYNMWKQAELTYFNYRDSEAYHNKMGEIIVKAVSALPSDQAWVLDYKGEWETTEEGIILDPLNFKKNIAVLI